MAESINAIRQHLESVKQTRQITNAMYLLSASRYKRTVAGMDYHLRYLESLRRTMRHILYVTKGAGLHDVYLDKSPAGCALFLVMMGDKGLCGNYNQAVAALAEEQLKKKPGAKLVCFGLSGEPYLRHRGIVPDRVFPGSSMHPDLPMASSFSKTLLEMYLTDDFNEVYVIYTPHASRAGGPVSFRMLPLLRHDFSDVSEADLPTEILYDPSAAEVFAHIVPQYCTGLLYDFMMQSAACENAARMEAMQSATENADKMLQTLQLRLNEVRQQTITNEITEIAAASALREKGI
ncbi:MAG: ATP synthase F1 subunit gamma [Clostridia bacterium]|nr:ATP synthase F1 subunit gamma [Clostridia bacterium]